MPRLARETQQENNASSAYVVQDDSHHGRQPNSPEELERAYAEHIGSGKAF